MSTTPTWFYGCRGQPVRFVEIHSQVFRYFHQQLSRVLTTEQIYIFDENSEINVRLISNFVRRKLMNVDDFQDFSQFFAIRLGATEMKWIDVCCGGSRVVYTSEDIARAWLLILPESDIGRTYVPTTRTYTHTHTTHGQTDIAPQQLLDVKYRRQIIFCSILDALVYPCN
jgi:hypothetical protein